MAHARTARHATADAADRPKVSYLIGRLERALRRRLNEVLGPSGLSLAQYTTLSVLNARGQLSNAQLAQRAFISPQAMNEVVQALEARELVARRPDPSNARVVQLALTASGLEVLRRCDAAVRQLEQTMLSRLSASEREALRDSLNACVQVLEEQAP